MRQAREVIQTPEVPTADATYRQAIRAGGFLFVSGQTGVNPQTGRLISDSVAEQARQAIENTAAILRAAGSSLANVLSVIAASNVFHQRHEPVIHVHLLMAVEQR